MKPPQDPSLPSGMSPSSEARFKHEADFFDGLVYDDGPISQSTIVRYLNTPHPYTPAERPFALLGDVKAKTILECGCGDGANSILLAMKGAAQVVGVDLSRAAIRAAEKKARLHGVADKIQFYAQPLEHYLETADKQFDVIIGIAILHHVLPVIDWVMSNLKRLGHRQTTFLFVEPVAKCAALRKIRLLLPVPIQGTPEERPLSSEDLKLIRKYLPNAEFYFQSILSRFWHRFIKGRIEDYFFLKRWCYYLICLIDELLLKLPLTSALASRVIILSR